MNWFLSSRLRAVFGFLGVLVLWPSAALAGATGGTAPVVTCTLTATQVDATNKPNMYRFTITTNANAADILGYRFSSTEQVGEVLRTGPEQSYIEKEVKFNTLRVDGQVRTNNEMVPLSDTCSATVRRSAAVAGTQTTSPAPPQTQTQPQPTNTITPSTATPTPTTSEPLPATGPASALGGALGLAGIGLATRWYLRSRKSLKQSLRNI